MGTVKKRTDNLFCNNTPGQRNQRAVKQTGSGNSPKAVQGAPKKRIGEAKKFQKLRTAGTHDQKRKGCICQDDP